VHIAPLLVLASALVGCASGSPFTSREELLAQHGRDWFRSVGADYARSVAARELSANRIFLHANAKVGDWGFWIDRAERLLWWAVTDRLGNDFLVELRTWVNGEWLVYAWRVDPKGAVRAAYVAPFDPWKPRRAYHQAIATEDEWAPPPMIAFDPSQIPAEAILGPEAVEAGNGTWNALRVRMSLNPDSRWFAWVAEACPFGHVVKVEAEGRTLWLLLSAGDDAQPGLVLPDGPPPDRAQPPTPEELKQARNAENAAYLARAMPAPGRIPLHRNAQVGQWARWDGAIGELWRGVVGRIGEDLIVEEREQVGGYWTAQAMLVDPSGHVKRAWLAPYDPKRTGPVDGLPQQVAADWERKISDRELVPAGTDVRTAAGSEWRCQILDAKKGSSVQRLWVSADGWFGGVIRETRGGEMWYQLVATGTDGRPSVRMPATAPKDD
jgi:hypothetical protein